MTDRSVISLGGPEVPRVVDKQQRKREIALASIDLLARNGFATTSVSQIAQAAGVGKGTIYEYFDTKEELISFALVVWIEELAVDVERRLEGVDDPEERLRALAQGSVEVFISDERSIQVAIKLFQDMLTSGPALGTDLVREAFRGLRQAIIDTLLDGISRGTFRPEIARDAERIAINLTAYLDGIGLHYYMSQRFFDLREQVDHQVDLLLESLWVVPEERR
jgi:AcrR family transcriptional regulator